MASSGITLAPDYVYVVTLPDKSMYPDPYVFIRQDQAEELTAAFPGAEWFECKLHMWLNGKRAIEWLKGERHL